jgi:hypothetical protein
MVVYSYGRSRMFRLPQLKEEIVNKLRKFYMEIDIDRGLLLIRKLLNQGFLLVKLKSSLRMFCGRHHDLVDRYGILSQMTTDMFHLS